MSETTTHIEKKTAVVPELRFKEFDGEWKKKKIGQILSIGSGKDYKHLSEGEVPVFGTGGLMAMVNEPLHEGETVFIGRKGTIHNPFYFNGKFWTVDTLFYTHDFIESTPSFIYPIFKRINWYKHNEASGVPSLSKKTIESINVYLPSLTEQQKIASFLSAVDEKIQQLIRKKELLEDYKKGIMQQIFSQQIRFKDENGNDFPDWKTKKLNYFISVSKKKNGDLKYDKNDVLSVSGEFGIVNQIEFQGRSFAGASVHNYGVVETGDIVYTKSPLKSNPYGIIKVNKGKAGIVSTLYAVYKVKDNSVGEYFDYYFQLDDNTNRYLRPLVHKGAKNDMKISDERVLIDPITVPSKDEQMKICQYLNTLDDKIEESRKQLEQTQTFKKGLLQKMFVAA